jgi:acyl carrier protein
MSKTKRRLIECFGKVFPEIPESDIPLATQAKVPTWDSACSVSLLTAIEEEFEIGVDEELVQSVDSFASLNSYLETRSTSGATGFSLRLHHVGFVVRDIERSVEGFKNSLGMTWDAKIYADPKQKVKVTFLATGTACAQIELVEPAGERLAGDPVSRGWRRVWHLVGVRQSRARLGKGTVGGQ